jgi:hypothetical protein
LAIVRNVTVDVFDTTEGEVEEVDDLKDFGATEVLVAS